MSSPISHDLVLTVISDDKPGVVETLAQTIANHGGNWLESRMSRLAGKFAGILRVGISEQNAQPLHDALEALHERGLKVVVEYATPSASQPECRSLTFNLVGPDRPGIVREIAQALASRNINMEQLSTDYSGAPWTGEPLFEATGRLQVPVTVDLDELYEQLETIADELAVDIKLEEPEPTARSVD